MRTVAMLRFPDKAAWRAVRDRFVIETDTGGAYLPGVICIVERGTEYDSTGRMVDVDGMQTPEMSPIPGWHVHVLLMGRELDADLWQYLDNSPARHVYIGHEVLSMPEQTEDDGDVILVERAPGAAASAEQVTRAEVEHVRRKLTAEEREERRALHAATLKVIEARAERDRLAAERDAINTRISALAAERAEHVAIRDKAVADLAGRVGAARTPFIRVRDAATEAIRAAADAIAAEQVRRTDAISALQAAADVLLAARADRDKLRA